MITIIITGVIALIVGFVLGYLLINMTLKYRSKNIIKEAEAEAEVIKKDKILQAKEKFLQIKAEHEKQDYGRGKNDGKHGGEKDRGKNHPTGGHGNCH